jgi:hypothetical protein
VPVALDPEACHSVSLGTHPGVPPRGRAPCA